MHYTKKYTSPIGLITIASDGENITGLWFDNQKYFGSSLEKESQEKDLPVLVQAAQWLDCYFGDKSLPKAPPLKLNGSPFRMEVWKILQSIPYGEVMTYGEIAAEISKQRGVDKLSAQAVGGAVGHNPISIIVPCHRVVGSNGSLTGFAGGIEKKIYLLKKEGVSMDRFFVPKKGTAL